MKCRDWRQLRQILVVTMFMCTMLSRLAVAQPLNFEQWSSLFTLKIPPRSRMAMSGSQFVDHVSNLSEQQREIAIRNELIKGNIPNFLRNLNPVMLKHAGGDDSLPTAVIFVTPDYMAIGSDNDFLRIPMNRHTASHIATSFGSILPTPKMVDAIYATADYHLRPRPMTPGPEMCSTEYYRTHNRLVDKQCTVVGVISGELVAGHKKDVVFTNRLKNRPRRVAIYGWHRSEGRPIQPLSYVHGATYADYSHGIRLVSDIVLIDGRPRSIFEVLSDTRLAGLLSNEGPFQSIRANTKRVPNLAKH